MSAYNARIPAGLSYSTVYPSMDFETYSPAGYKRVENDAHGSLIINGRKKWVPPYSIVGIGSQGKGGLNAVPVSVYAEDPLAEILSLVYDLKDGLGRRFWMPLLPAPIDLHNHIAAGLPIEAWNVTFEFWIWNMIGVRRFDWPPLELHQCHCAMAKSRRFGLPGGLDLAAQVLGTPEKDKRGKTLLQKLTRPHTPTKTRPECRWTPQTAPADFRALYEYNDGDVYAEDCASAKIPDLTPYERQTWLLDQTINLRGVAVDVETLDAALDVHRQAISKYEPRLNEITQGAVQTVGQSAKFIEWVNSRGVFTTSLDINHRAEILKRTDIPDDVRAALDIAEMISSANIKKLYTLKRSLSSDGRLRDAYTYCGADQTGRWSSGGVQLQNMTAKGPEGVAQCEACNRYFVPHADTCPHCGAWMWRKLQKGEWPVAAVESAILDVRTGSLEHVERIWGPPVDVLCGILRGLFIAAEGKKFVCCDFSAIEAVAAACLARCDWRIKVFQDPTKCIYTESASTITGTPVEVYKEYKKAHGSDHPDRKKIGKIAELASGYGGWINAWLSFGCELPEDEIKQHLLAWRAASPEIVDMWGGQFRWCGPGKWDYRPELHGLEGCAIQAIMYPGQCFSYNDITYGVKDEVLYCRLPSGRFLHYHRPRLEPAEDKLRRGPAVKIVFEGYNTNTQKGPVGWIDMETFGGRLFENVVQAVSCDLQAEALHRCEQAGYPIVLHTHDEGCAEVPDSPRYNVETMAAIMTSRPSWASWWPIRAAGWEHKRYQKD